MSILRDRINGLHQTTNTNPGGVPTLPYDGKDYRAVREIPMMRVAMYPSGIGYDEPIIAPDGGILPSTGHGRWGQLYAAGR